MVDTATPLVERGYVKTGNVSWWLTEEETAPELRWPMSIDVFSQMRRQDAQVTSVLRAVTMPVTRTNWWIEPNGARDEVVEFCARNLGLPIRGAGDKAPVGGRKRDRFSWHEHLRLALLMLVFGHSIFEQVYRADNPTDPHRFDLRKLMWLPPRTISAFHTARDGGLDSIQQYGQGPDYKADPLGINRLVVYVNDREGAGWQGQSLLRPAYKHWIIKDRLLRVQAQSIERNGMGVPVYEGAEGETDLSKGLAMAKAVRAGDTSGAAVPWSARLRLSGVEGQMTNADPAIRYHDEQIARAVLAHFLNLGTQTGSWALGTTFADFFTLSLQTVAEGVADVATAHVVEDLVDVNWGEDEPAPAIGHEEIGARQAATAQAIKLLTDAGILLPDRPLEEAIREQHNLPPIDPNARRLQPRPAPGQEPAEEPAEEPAGMPAD